MIKKKKSGPVVSEKEWYGEGKFGELVKADEVTPGADRVTVLLTPAAAADWIQLNTSNRRVRFNYVNYLTEQIQQGLWVYDGNPIRFDWDGNLIDGQHRLLAVIKAQKAVVSDVLANLDPRAKDVVDTGIQRTMSDVLTMRSLPYGSQLAAALRVLYCYNQTPRMSGFNGKRIPHTVLLAYYEKHPTIMESVAYVGCRFTRMAPGSAAAALHYILYERDAEAANKFIRDLWSGDGLPADDPVMVLREKLLRNKSFKEKGTERVTEVLALGIKAWNLRKERRRVKSLFWRDKGENPEPFPEPK